MLPRPLSSSSSPLILLFPAILMQLCLMATPASNCRLSEFQCRRSSTCIRLDQVCDGRDDCGDRSDEAEGCTHCNRTFYGDVGRTYRLSIPRPRADRLPFICSLTFVANQYELGDLVQLVLEEFKLGRFQSPHHRGCPDGHLQVYGGGSKRGGGGGGGQYCGRLPRGAPRPVFLSADGGGDGGDSSPSRLVATIRFYQFYGDDPEDDFSLRLRYKFLPRKQPVFSTRGEPEFDFGTPVPGTSCSRVFNDCVHRKCRIRSPGYPGLYPRNTTCKYRVHVRGSDVPRGLRPMVVLNQSQSSKLAIRAEVVRKFGSEDRSLGLWSDCDALGDRVSVHDGRSAADPVLIEFCRGAALLPEVAASGADAIVVLRTAPYGQPRLEPFSANGFELDVLVRTVSASDTSTSSSPSPSDCRFEISSPSLGSMRRGVRRSGVLRNVRHDLPANATCRYRFAGRRGELVWVTFLRFEVRHRKVDLYRAPDCGNRLALYDGGKGRRRMGEFCENSPPRLCDHAFLTQEQLQDEEVNESESSSSVHYRACSWGNESYVSSSSELSLVETVSESTAVTALNFAVRYEFVNTLQDGKDNAAYSSSPLPSSSSSSSLKPYSVDNSRWSCHRLFDSTDFSSGGGGSSFPFASPSNVFLFGRGGRRDLACSYTFRGRPGERVRLELERLVTGGGDVDDCHTVPHPELPGHSVCEFDRRQRRRRRRRGGTATLWVSELPDGSTPIRQHCFCRGIGGGDDDDMALDILSNTSSLRVELFVSGMTPQQDYEDFRLSGRFSFVHEPSCQLRRRLARGPGGRIHLSPHSSSSYGCPDRPWVVEAARPGRYIFLKVSGVIVFSGPNAPPAAEEDGAGNSSSSSSYYCDTRNRILVYSGDRLTIICPASGPGDRNGLRSVELFSDGWERSREAKASEQQQQQARQHRQTSSMVIKLSTGDASSIPAGGYVVQWLELSPTPEPNNAALSISDGDGIVSAAAAAASGAGGGAGGGVGHLANSCAYACPELSGCIGAELWCDGTAHCPSGFDESEQNCAHLFAPVLYAYGAAAASFLALVFAVIVVVQRLRARKEAAQRRRSMGSAGSLQQHGMKRPSSSSAGMSLGGGGGGSVNGGLALYHQGEESITNLAKEGSASGTLAGSQYHLVQHQQQQQLLLQQQQPLNGSATVMSSMDHLAAASAASTAASGAASSSNNASIEDLIVNEAS